VIITADFFSDGIDATATSTPPPKGGMRPF
jgi:hypothetical protein